MRAAIVHDYFVQDGGAERAEDGAVYAITRFFASNQGAPVGVNWSYYANPAVDALVNEALTTFDAAKQDALMARIHEKVVKIVDLG